MAQDVGQRIKEARLRQGWTQTQLAEQVGATKKSVGMWERTGQLSPLNMGRLAQVLPELSTQGEWVEAAPTRTLRRLTMEAPLPELTASEPPLETLRRVRRELTRMTAELDKVVEALETNG